VVDSGSSRTLAASLKLIRRLVKFRGAAFPGSHSNSTARVYGSAAFSRQAAERQASGAAGSGSAADAVRRRLQAIVRRDIRVDEFVKRPYQEESLVRNTASVACPLAASTACHALLGR